MNRRIILACVLNSLAIVALWLLIGRIAVAAPILPPAPRPVYSQLSVPRVTVTRTLSLSETLASTPVYTMTVSEGMPSSLPLGVHNPLPAQVTVTAQLVEVLPATNEDSALDMFSFSPVSQTVAAEEVVTFTLSLVEPLSETESYSGTLKLSTTGPGLTPTKTITQPFGLQVSVSPPEPAEAVLTPTLRLVGPNSETLSSPLVRHVLVADQGEQLLQLQVYDPLTSEVTIVAELGEVHSATGESVPATLGLWPGSQTVSGTDVATFTLSLAEGWLPIGTYSGTLTFSAPGTVPAIEQFALRVSPWPAVLEWAQEGFVYEIDTPYTNTVRFVARYGDAKDIWLELTTLEAGDSVTSTFSTAKFLTVTPPLTWTQDSVAEFVLDFNDEELPEPGRYRGTLRLSASNAAPITAPFTLVISEERARGSYRLAVAELGQTPPVTTALTLTTALQFSGVRWLPGSTSVLGDWWPIGVGVLLLVVGLSMLVGYTLWAGHKIWALLLVVLVMLGVMLWALSNFPFNLTDLTQAHVGGRNLLIWEAQGRGPVRKVKVLAKEVANEVGDTGEIVIGRYDEEITTANVLTVPITEVTGLSRPGVYQGRILIQSPDIAGGVEEVSVQVTVHDLIFWPALVILLGVVLGGWVKYQQEIASQRLEKRRDIERVWQRWDDYMLHDDYLWPSSDGGVREINPIYENVWWELEYARELLAEEDEWGIEDADRIVGDVGERLTTYHRLAKAVADWRDEQKREIDETSRQQLQKWVDGVVKALYRGELDHATDLIGKMTRKTLPVRLGRLDNLAKTITDEKAKKAIQALLAEAKELYIKENYGQAWLKFKEADYEIRAQGIEVPLFPPSLLEPKSALEGLVGVGLMTRDVANAILGSLPEEMVPRLDFENQMVRVLGADTTALVRPWLGVEGYAGLPDPDSPKERYVIRSPAWIRRSARNTVPLRVECRVENPRRVLTFRWDIQPDTAKYTHETRVPENEIEFREEGSYKVTVIVEEQDGTQLPNDKQPDPLEFQIEPSGMEAIYQAKRRHNFNRRLAAGLLALVAGMGAKKVFGLTFGSFEEYLGTFAWGVGVSLGIDPAANGYQHLKNWVQTKLLKVKKEATQEEQSRQSDQPNK